MFKFNGKFKNSNENFRTLQNNLYGFKNLNLKNPLKIDL